ncbi:MAG TPA: hypothetical protein VFV75_18700 [Candidatus Polarisedimenticolaceae bacterium]|nr:hypothetical protein [Candidatus Polarisedimenticolaceae bacterium]
MRIRVALAGASLMLAGLALAESAPASPAPVAGQGGLITPGRSPELEVLFTGDVVGFLEPCG